MIQLLLGGVNMLNGIASRRPGSREQKRLVYLTRYKHRLSITTIPNSPLTLIAH